MIGKYAYGQTAYGSTQASHLYKFGDSDIAVDLQDSIAPERIRDTASAVEIILNTLIEANRKAYTGSDIEVAINQSSDLWIELQHVDGIKPFGGVAWGSPGLGSLKIKGKADLEIDIPIASLANATFGGKTAINLEATIESIPLKALYGIANITTSISASATIKKVRIADSNIDIVIDVTPDIGTTARIGIQTNVDALANQIAGGSSTIQIISDIVSEATRKRIVDSGIGLSVDIDGLSLRKRSSDVTPTIESNITGTSLRERDVSTDLDLTIDSSVDPERLREVQSAITATLDIISEIKREAHVSSDISIDPDTLFQALRIRGVDGDIEIDVDTHVVAAIGKLLILFEGSLAPGEKAIIDTEDLTIVDQNGNNLRDQFTIHEWIKILGSETLTWDGDGEVTIEIEKQDRNI